jgi:hypothetical protein
MDRKSILFGFCLVAFAVGAAAQTVTGSGTTNTVPVFTGSSAVGNSPISVSGSSVGIGTTYPTNLLDIEINTDVSSGPQGVLTIGNIYLGTGIPGSAISGQYENNGYTFSMGQEPLAPSNPKSLSLSGGSVGSNLAFLDSVGGGAASITFGSATNWGHNITVQALASQTPDVFDVLSSPASGGKLLFNVQPSGNVTASGSVTAATFYGSGSGLTGIPYSSLTGTPNTVTTPSPSGTSGYVPYFTGSTTIENSPIVVSGSNVGIGMGTATPGSLLSLGSTQVTPKLLVFDGGTAIEGFGALPHEFRMFGVAGSGNFISFGQVSSTDGVTWAEQMRLQGGGLGINTGASPAGALSVVIGGGAKGVPSAAAGAGFQLLGTTGWGDSNTAASGTATGVSFATIGQESIYAVNTGVTTTNAYTLNILGPAKPGTNETFTNSTALNVASAALSNTTTGYGLQVAAPTGATSNYAAAFTGGNVGIGTTNPGGDLTGALIPPSGTSVLDVQGDIELAQTKGGSIIFQDGSVQSYAWNGVLNGGDYAEDMRATGNKVKYEPGDVLVLAEGDNADVQKSAEPYSAMVAGIYATKPGVVGRREAVAKSADNVPMAMVGVVPTKVSAENGPIRKGDLLVSASLPGYAMKGTDRGRMLGAVLGKAMGSLDSGTGVIEVLVTLQ